MEMRKTNLHEGELQREIVSTRSISAANKN
jgi:hypothetical protein